MGYTVARTDGLAIASLVLGILSIPGGLVFYGVLGIVSGALAIVFGLVARRRIKQSGGTVAGGGLATAGWILGICGVAIGVAVIAVLVALISAFQSTSTH
jgi:hypothetical protein